MLELPESFTIANQLNDTIRGKTIMNVVANHSPHSFAWYSGDPGHYPELLNGKTVGAAYARAGMVEIEVQDCRIVFCEGASPHYIADMKDIPNKHQLCITFTDHSALVFTVQMYGGLYAYYEGENDNIYYMTAMVKPSPLTKEFTYPYFLTLREGVKETTSMKAFLATEQRIPGLGNGVLQDILFQAKLSPKHKLKDLTTEQYRQLYESIKDTLRIMSERGGRDTEKDLFGRQGGYHTLMSKNTAGTPCPNCGTIIEKGTYLGGSIYYCVHCQQ